MMKGRNFLVVLFFCFFMLSVAGTVAAQATFPVRPIQAIVAYPPGGTVDLSARVITDSMQKYFGQAVVVINRAGGGTAIAGNEVFKAKPDGYTIGMFTGMSTAPEYGQDPERFLYKSTDLQAVAQWSTNMSILMIRADDPRFTTLEEMVAYAKANPGKLRINHTGRGGTTWAEGESFAQSAGIKLTGVPYQGVTDAMPPLLGGDLDVVLSTWGTVTMGLTEAKKIKVVAIIGAENKGAPQLPGVKTLAEYGYPVDIPDNFLATFVTGATPPAIVSRLNEAILHATTKDPDVKRKLMEIGMAPTYKDSQELTALVKRTGEITYARLKAVGLLK